MKKLYFALFEESLIRQMYWIFHGEEQKNTTKKLLLESYGDDQYFDKFEKDINFKMNYFDEFIQDLHEAGIFEQVVDIICNDKGFLDHIFIGKEKVRGQVENRLEKSFKRLYNECSKEGKNKLKELILDHLYFGNYFDGSVMVDDSGLYETFKVDEILKNLKNQNMNKFLEEIFKTQKGNQLYIISFFAQKKIEEPGFLEELEKNYGVYLDVDNFIKDMKKKLEEIKSYKDFYSFIGTDFGKDKEEIELIIEAYGKAKEKGYIKSFNNSQESSFYSRSHRSNLLFSNNSIFNRPRFDRDDRHRYSRDRDRDNRRRNRINFNDDYSYSSNSRSYSSRSRSRNGDRNRNRYDRNY